MTSFNFSGKKVLVVGGSRGIGKGVVDAFLLLGAKVFYASRRPASEDTLAKFIKVDLNKEKQIIQMFEEIDKSGDLDIVVNTAAINFCNKIDNISTDEWDMVESVNLRAAFIISRESVVRMKCRGSGKIVNVSSIAGRHHSLVSGAHYVSTKAGLIGLTRQLAYEVGPYNINVNVVCPSQTMSDMLNDSMSTSELRVLAKKIPLRRIASIEDQVGPILFLCSDLASYITGAVIDVNGGQV